VNEPGVRSCSGCGKWPSLFDLQNTVDDPVATGDAQELELEDFDPELFDPETFDPETFGAETFESQPFEPEPVETQTFEPEVDEEEELDRGRLRRWVISAIWVIGIIVWFVANTFGDR
jgi:hypothetical protein